MSNAEKERAWVEVDLAALEENYRAVREAAPPGTALIPMVKADAYGLGARRVVRALDPLGPWGYGVAAVEEGVDLRRAGVERPVVVFSPMAPQAVARAAAARLTASISDLASLERWAAEAGRVGQTLDFHVEIDTGMGRAGFTWSDAAQWSQTVARGQGSHLRWAGVYTHFLGADEADPEATRVQWERFEAALSHLSVPRESLVVHACNSAAAMRWPRYAGDAVRPGVFLYGGRIGGLESPALARPPRAVASVRARIVRVYDARPGSTLGYGATHRAERPERWATLAIGYGDGLPRALGNRGSALVGGARVAIVGRISMDMTVVDVTDVPSPRPGDIATLIGRDGGEEITVDEVAALAGTISYEILTGLGPRLPRVEVGDGIDG